MSQNKNILHLCSYFSGVSTVYENLFKKLDDLEHIQKVYVPYRRIKRDKDLSFLNPNSEVIWRPILNKLSRVAYFYKINKVYSDVLITVALEEVDCIHAHTWFTDGGVAYKLYKKHNIPYTITVRSTDLIIFSKYFIHTYRFARAILRNAKQIVFVSKAYELKTLSLPFLKKYQSSLKSKIEVIPNGIDDFWIQNVQPRKFEKSQNLRLLYIGSFIKRKNISRLIDALDIIKLDYPNVSLSIVGGGYSYSHSLEQRINNHENIKFLGKIYDRNILSNIIRENDIFVMPSYNETFGLVYIEALSQGIPVVFSKDDGIDGFHKEKIGEAVSPMNVKDIARGVLKVYDEYDRYDFKPQDIVREHNWHTIARALYKTI